MLPSNTIRQIDNGICFSLFFLRLETGVSGRFFDPMNMRKEGV